MDDTQATARTPGRVPVDAAKVRRARVEARLNQTQLAAKARIGRQWLSAIENGHASGSPETVGRLADALGVTIASLLTEETSP